MLAKEKQPTGLRVILRALSRRFGNDFEVNGMHSAEAALAALLGMADKGIQAALLLVNPERLRSSMLRTSCTQVYEGEVCPESVASPAPSS